MSKRCSLPCFDPLKNISNLIFGLKKLNQIGFDVISTLKNIKRR